MKQATFFRFILGIVLIVNLLISCSNKINNKYLKDAEGGDVEAQYLLGANYYYGKEITQDYTKAVYWFQKAAEQGDIYAQSMLGACYYEGTGVAQDYEEAKYWYNEAAIQGHKSAQFMLGACWYDGIGGDKDDIQAVYWFQKAAEQGDKSAQYYLGLCYDKGYGVKRDFKQALYWYEKAAEQGDTKAQKRLKEQYGDPSKGLEYILEVEYTELLASFYRSDGLMTDSIITSVYDNYTKNVILKITSETRTILNGGNNGYILELDFVRGELLALSFERIWHYYKGNTLEVIGLHKTKKFEDFSRFSSWEKKNITSFTVLSVKEEYVSADEIILK